HEPPAPRRKLSLRAAAGDGSASGDGGLDVAARDPTPSTDLLARERVRQLSDALETLPADERELLQLHVFEKLTWDEVAARQGLTVHQVKYQYQLLLQRLRRDLDRLP